MNTWVEGSNPLHFPWIHRAAARSMVRAPVTVRPSPSCCWPAAHLAARAMLPAATPPPRGPSAFCLAPAACLHLLHRTGGRLLAQLCLGRSRSAHDVPARPLLACLPSPQRPPPPDRCPPSVASPGRNHSPARCLAQPEPLTGALPRPAGATHRRHGPPIIPLVWIHSPAKGGTEFGWR